MSPNLSQCPFNTFLFSLKQFNNLKFWVSRKNLWILPRRSMWSLFATNQQAFHMQQITTSTSCVTKNCWWKLIPCIDMLSIFFFTHHQIFSYHIFVLQLGEIRLCCMNFVQPIHHDSVQFQWTEKNTKINSEKKCDLNIY